MKQRSSPCFQNLPVPFVEIYAVSLIVSVISFLLAILSAFERMMFVKPRYFNFFSIHVDSVIQVFATQAKFSYYSNKCMESVKKL